MGESGTRDAAAGLAEHSKDAAGGGQFAKRPEPQQSMGATVTATVDTAQEAYRGLIQMVIERPLTTLVIAGTFGWLIGRLRRLI